MFLLAPTIMALPSLESTKLQSLETRDGPYTITCLGKNPVGEDIGTEIGVAVDMANEIMCRGKTKCTNDGTPGSCKTLAYYGNGNYVSTCSSDELQWQYCDVVGSAMLRAIDQCQDRGTGKVRYYVKFEKDSSWLGVTIWTYAI